MAKITKWSFFNNLLIVVIFALVLVALLRMEPPLDWTPSYSRNHTVPLGNALLYEAIEHMFPKGEIYISETTLFEIDDEIYSDASGLIIINDQFYPDSESLQSLLEFVEKGGAAFVIAREFCDDILKKLGVDVEKDLVYGDSVSWELTYSKKESPFLFYNVVENNYFKNFDSDGIEVLGYNQFENPNLVKIDRGEGSFFVSPNPFIFTNYHVIGDRTSREYIFKTISLLPEESLIWSEFYKRGRVVYDSIFSFVLSKPSLQYGVYLFLTGLALYFIFQSRRKQRAIPIIKPHENHSLNFINTISELYYNRKEHRLIVELRYNYFKNFIKRKYYIDIQYDLLSPKFISELSEKSGVSYKSVEMLLKFMVTLLFHQKVVYIDDLYKFNRQLQFFYENCK
ncbi:hypothetical protein QA597_04020 [Marinilabiliaceae bacterium ANBcel2]|nr:hypothetical protein [Marinilabiliaceae bacterium ANBcel2]